MRFRRRSRFGDVVYLSGAPEPASSSKGATSATCVTGCSWCSPVTPEFAVSAALLLNCKTVALVADVALSPNDPAATATRRSPLRRASEHIGGLSQPRWANPSLLR